MNNLSLLSDGNLDSSSIVRSTVEFSLMVAYHIWGCLNVMVRWLVVDRRLTLSLRGEGGGELERKRQELKLVEE